MLWLKEVFMNQLGNLSIRNHFKHFSLFGKVHFLVPIFIYSQTLVHNQLISKVLVIPMILKDKTTLQFTLDDVSFI